MEEVLFFASALGALGGAVGVIAMRNPFYSVLALIVHLFSLAALFLLLTSAFVAAAQVVVYAGAVMVLYVFVVAYVGEGGESAWEPIPGQRFLAPLRGIALFVELSIAVLGSSLLALGEEGADVKPGFGDPAARVARTFSRSTNPTEYSPDSMRVTTDALPPDAMARLALIRPMKSISP